MQSVQYPENPEKYFPLDGGGQGGGDKIRYGIGFLSTHPPLDPLPSGEGKLFIGLTVWCLFTYVDYSDRPDIKMGP